MALQYIATGNGMAAIASDAATNERGFMVKVKNGTGQFSKKGLIVSASQAADNEVILQTNEFDAFGVMVETGIAAGSDMWIWVNGSICQVMFEDGVKATRGNICISSDVDGRADALSNPGTGLPAVETHFKECGHVLQTVDPGLDKLALVMIHFN
jgi:hypothetical protein